MSTASDARNHTIGLLRISEALIASGYTSLDEQAKALGINRSTAWTIIKTKHKLGRLSTKTTKRILSNPNTPPPVRAVVLQYLAERDPMRYDAASTRSVRHASRVNVRNLQHSGERYPSR